MEEHEMFEDQSYLSNISLIISNNLLFGVLGFWGFGVLGF